MRHIVFVLGTKAEFLRLFPLMLWLQEHGQPYDLVHTCQHELGDYLERFGIRPQSFIDFPEFKGTEIKVSPRNAWRALGLYRKLKRTLKDLNPSIVVYQGDTFTTGFAALACKRAKIRSAHVEAGFRSGNWREPFPEESIRRFADHRADVLFAPSNSARANLGRENVKGEVVVSGSTVRDGVVRVFQLPNSRPEGDYAVVTMHRYENVFSEEHLQRIIEILKLCHKPLVWPMHENARVRLEMYGLLPTLSNVKIVPPMEYADFMALVAGSAYTITDGGSLEEESVILGRRCLLLRKRTERTEAVDASLTFLTGLDLDKARESVAVIEGSPLIDSGLNPYHNGRSASGIIGERLLAG